MHDDGSSMQLEHVLSILLSDINNYVTGSGWHFVYGSGSGVLLNLMNLVVAVVEF